MLRAQRTTGPLGRERLEIKGFTSTALWAHFLNENIDRGWKEYDNILTPGVYAKVAQIWVNVKKLPPEVLAHV